MLMMKDLTNENVIHIKKNGIEYLQFKRLLEYEDKINHIYVLKNEDIDFFARPSSCEKEREKVFNSYKRVCDVVNIDYKNIVWTTQTHSDNILRVDKKILKNIPDIYLEELKNTDGLITDKPSIAITTSNADCILLIFYDPVKNVIGNTHSGWRGTIKKIGKKTVEKMKAEFGTDPKDLICCIMPSIQKCCFEVGKDVEEIFKKTFGYSEQIDKIVEFKCMEEENPKYLIDTVLCNRIMLEEVGLKNENIILSNLCSKCNNDIIHSRRAEGPDYRVGSAIIELRINM